MNCVRPFFRRFLFLIFACFSLACGGCWEEVRYDPQNIDPQGADSQDEAFRSDNLHERPAPAKIEATEAAGQTPSDPPNNQPPAPELTDSAPPVMEDEGEEENAIARADESLADALDSQENLLPKKDSPAPASDLDWLDDPPSSESTVEPRLAVPPRNAAAAWRAGSKWSLAAAYFAKGLGADRYGEPLEQAKYAARLLKIDLPAMPESLEKASLQSAMVRYLLEEGGPRFVDQLKESYPADHGALAELAIQTHALLLVYTPGNKDLEPLVSSIGLAAEHSGLPDTVWQSLVDLLRQRADFSSIKQAVFLLHEEAADFLAGSAGK